MVRDFDRKLRLTAAALGCGSCKELAARFRLVNPRTPFDLERAYKWLQGRALPRQQQVYADWAALLDLGRPLDWLMACDVEGFLGALCERVDLPRELLLRRAEAFGGGTMTSAGARVGGDGYLCGVYAGYSHAWSPYYAGRLIRGTLHLELPQSRARLMASYTETLPTGQVRVDGPALAAGRSLHIHLREPGSEVPLFMSLYRPAPPASVLAGFLVGATFVGPDPRPSVSRIVLVRMPAPAVVVQQGERYLEPGEALAADLVAAGLAVSTPVEVDARLSTFLQGPGGSGFDQVLAEQYAEIATMFDHLLITSMESRAALRPAVS
jgi:hypothetical protein